MIQISIAFTLAVLVSISPIALGASEPGLGERATAHATAPLEAAPPVGSPVPAVDYPFRPDAPYSRGRQPEQGTATSTWQYQHLPEDGRSIREHGVTNPRGEMTHTWERVNTDDGYHYRRTQTWTGPDGTPIRQHEYTLSRSDPHNYTRERSMTLPDGRTIQHTHVHSWDGTEGTMERSFVGPNGQTREDQRSWSPQAPASEPATSATAPVQPSGLPAVTAPSAFEPAEKSAWWRSLNSLGEGSRATEPSAAVSAPRRGFTIGTGNGGASQAHSRAKPTVPASQNTHRPSWGGGIPRSTSQPGPPPHAHGPSAAPRANPGRGNNR